jgi:hypothetical protein
MRHLTILLSLLLLASCGKPGEAPPDFSGELKVGHTITLTFSGPEASETGDVNPFTDYRMYVRFQRGKKSYKIAGYFAADGNAAETGATSGNKWRAHFVPETAGEYHYNVYFRHAPDIVSDPDLSSDNAPKEHPHGRQGRLFIDKAEPGTPEAKGMLHYVESRYLQWGGTDEWFIKGGADSPENFLAYADFDGTHDVPKKQTKKGEAKAPDFLHKYEPHIRDWKPGDPTWQNGKGKGMIGALNYLASKGLNSVYFLPMNVIGDGNDTWPWIAHDVRDRYDCSKLDQWNIVFDHMDKLGLMLHVVTAESENDHLLDEGELGPERRAYYRELIARFGHHRALVWNMGEENDNSAKQIKAFCAYIKLLDNYQHPIVMHTNSTPEHHEKRYAPLLGYEYFDGASMQIREDELVHGSIKEWIDRSADAGRPWVVTFDEQRTGATGVQPDDMDPNHDADRDVHLYATLFAGGAGIEWYFGYQWHDNDLTCEDWRTRENLWTQTKIALDFMQLLPFTEMEGADDLTTAANDYVFAKAGEVYAVYLPQGGTTTLDLGEAASAFSVQWFNPRTGSAMQNGSVTQVTGPGKQGLGNPPADADKDWVVLVKRK